MRLPHQQFAGPSSSQPISSSQYRGRFAPSPSGPLHFGSLVCAVASYLDAKANQGQWLLRIDDIDPLREQPGASTLILFTLEKHGLVWDQSVIFQSHSYPRYAEILKILESQTLLYRCDCNRKKILEAGGYYDGHCRYRYLDRSPTAIRINLERCFAQFPQLTNPINFMDRIQGIQLQDIMISGDFILHRKDGLYAYHLASVVDDITENINQVVRGTDLLPTTANQILLYTVLGHNVPQYCHIPVLVNADGVKLSKQNHAQAVDDSKPSQNIHQALDLLGLHPPQELQNAPPQVQLSWGIENWQLDKIQKRDSITVSE